MKFEEKLIKYYSSGYEGKRLQKDKYHSIEYLTTVRYLDRLLPDSGKVLDCCAGGGVYSYYLADRGYNVTAADLSPKNIEIIKANKKSSILDDIQILNVLNLSCFEGKTFDVVLCMGALYHLKRSEERRECVKECLRVLKDDGIFILAYINRNPCVLYQFWQQPKNIKAQAELIKTGDNGLFYASDFDEIDKIVTDFNLAKIKNIGADGSAYPLQRKINSLNKAQFADFLEYHFAVCEQPSIIGNSMHGLLFARKENSNET
ncbi:MAG: class I SAM-dependent methyltransferase [Eubacterium sp.]|nr:class I SAM-dependent methyltransferase [Eubacterium sp.]